MTSFQDSLNQFDTLSHQGFQTNFLAAPTPGSAPIGSAGASGNGAKPSAPTSGPSGTPSSAVALPSASGGLIGGLLDGLFSSRIVAILLGLMMIAGAIFLFGADELFSTVQKHPLTKALV